MAGTKTAASRRTVELAPLALTLLREQVLARPNRGREGEEAVTSRHVAVEARLGATPVPGASLLFTSPTGKTLNRDSFESRHFRPATRAAGLASPEKLGEKVAYDGPSFHSTRHSFASLLIAANVHPRVAAALMGHADNGGLFLKLYGHLYSAAASEAVLALDRVVRAGIATNFGRQMAEAE